MKIIDLLNKIEKGEDIPPKFKCDGYIWEYKEAMKDWYSYQNKCYIFSEYFKENLKNCLWYEIEIIEDKPSKIEKLDYKYKNMYGNISAHRHSEVDIIDKVNEIREAVNYLLEKSNKE